MQNGVENERRALRHFPRTFGMCVMCPASQLHPGVVQVHSAPVSGLLDLGCFPSGLDAQAQAIADAIDATPFESVARPDIMRWKYRKLVNNLGNAVEALCGHELDDADARSALELLEGEAAAVFAVAAIDPVGEAEDRERRGDHLRVQPVAGATRGGGSTWQSLARGSGVETDYLNGEVALLGRLHGVPTPANARIQTLMTQAAARGLGPGPMTASALLAELRGS
jgi:2-dehydropantoate 2-reductase